MQETYALSNPMQEPYAHFSISNTPNSIQDLYQAKTYAHFARKQDVKR